MKYKPEIVTAFLKEHGIPAPVYEYRFHPVRKWRFDLAFPDYMLYIEVQGGLWIRGGHNRGAQMLKDYEKWNAASCYGWRGLWCQPKDLCTVEMADTIGKALHFQHDLQKTRPIS